MSAPNDPYLVRHNGPGVTLIVPKPDVFVGSDSIGPSPKETRPKILY